MGPATDVRRRNHVTELGAGPRTIVFANGFGCDQNIWRFVAPAFAADHRVVLFDYVGLGRADLAAYDPRRYASLDGYASDIVEVADALDLGAAVLVAHSVGCSAAVLAALAAPARFERLVLITPSPRFLNDPPAYVGGFDRSDVDALLDMMDRNFGGWAAAFSGTLLKEPELSGELRDMFCALDRRVARRIAEVAFLSAGRADLRRVSHPSLVLQCSIDDVVPASARAYVLRHLRRSRHVTLDVAGHCPHVSHPREVEAAVRDHLGVPAAEL